MTLRSPAFPSRMAGVFRKRPKVFFLLSDERFPERVVNAPKADPTTTSIFRADAGSYRTLIRVSC